MSNRQERLEATRLKREQRKKERMKRIEQRQKEREKRRQANIDILKQQKKSFLTLIYLFVAVLIFSIIIILLFSNTEWGGFYAILTPYLLLGIFAMGFLLIAIRSSQARQKKYKK